DLVARLFREIARGEIGGPSGTREMLALLSRDVNPAKPFEDLELEDARLAGQRLPAGTRFWSKSGDAYDVHHLVARASLPGRPARMIGSRLLSRLLGAAIGLHRATLRVERLHYDHYLEVKARGVPILFALWHGRMYLSIQAHRRQGIVTMASQSRDGEWIARWLEKNGYVVVRGST